MDSDPTTIARWRVAGGARGSPWLMVSLVALAVAMMTTVAWGPTGVARDDPRIYVEAAESIAHGDYRSDSEVSGLPRYPPGFPLMLAPFVAAAGDRGAELAGIFFGVALTGLVWLCAHRLGGARASALAALCWMLSPLASDYATGVMSDAAAASMVMLALLAVMAERWVLAGMALGWSCWIRLVHVPFLAGLGARRRPWLVAALLLLPLAVFQVQIYGRLAGYDGDQAQFSLANMFGGTSLLYLDTPSPWPNWQFVPGLLMGLRGGVVPLLFLFAAYELWAARAAPVVRLATWVLVANVLIYLPYYFQAARFMLPGACVVLAFGACGVVRLLDALSTRGTGDAVVGAP